MNGSITKPALARTPPMGWNSWNTFGAEINAQILLETIEAFGSSGLKQAGYEFVVIDDFWQADERINGRLAWDPRKFPQGIKPIAEKLHEHGLKFGMYSCAGTRTCGGKPGSYGFEEIDAQTFAEWGVDFLKYDYCHVPAGVDGVALFQRMGQALRGTGRPIVYSICEWGRNRPWDWGSRVGGHLWRTTGDIDDSWESIVEIGFEKQIGLGAYAGVGHWNDPDMLVVGMYGKGNEEVAQGGCTLAEYRSHFTLWCLLAAPLIIGCDVRNLDQDTLAILSNPWLINVNQDPLGRQGYKVGEMLHAQETAQVWVKPLADGSIAVGLFNLGLADNRLISIAWESVGIPPGRKCAVIDLWNGETIGDFQSEFSVFVNSHDVAAVRLVPQFN